MADFMFSLSKVELRAGSSEYEQAEPVFGGCHCCESYKAL